MKYDDDDNYEEKSAVEGKLLLGDCLSFISTAIVPSTMYILCNIHPVEWFCIVLFCISLNKFLVLCCVVLFCIVLF